MINFPDPDYLQNVIKPHLSTRFSTVERLYLPMIDRAYDTRNAVPPVIWGMLWKNWQPNAAEGNTVFLESYENRGAHNYKKKIYYSGVTPDLYRCQFRDKVRPFFRWLLDEDNANRPLMNLYLKRYFDLYWDLHLGKSDKDIPDYATEIGQLFNDCMANIAPLDPEFYRKYMKVRALRDHLDRWILRCVDELEEVIKNEETGAAEKAKEARKTIVYHWLRNIRNDSGNRPPDFVPSKDDIAFECFHNFVAFNQWGNTIYNIMDRLRPDGDHPEVREAFRALAAADDCDKKGDDDPFTPLDRFVMELFRTILPNDASISTLAKSTRLGGETVYTKHDHRAISNDELHWENPHDFDPKRYLGKPTSDQIDEDHCQKLGFARCPFSQQSVETYGGGKVTNSGFGTVYNDDKKGNSEPVLEHAGYAPFGFGYRRCPGELLTVEVIKEFLNTVIEKGVEFKRLPGKHEKVPVAPGTIVEDSIGFEIKS